MGERRKVRGRARQQAQAGKRWTWCRQLSVGWPSISQFLMLGRARRVAFGFTLQAVSVSIVAQSSVGVLRWHGLGGSAPAPHGGWRATSFAGRNHIYRYVSTPAARLCASALGDQRASRPAAFCVSVVKHTQQGLKVWRKQRNSQCSETP